MTTVDKIKQIQGILLKTQDGLWGPQSQGALDKASKEQLKKIQGILGSVADGIWGPKSKAALEALKVEAKNYKEPIQNSNDSDNDFDSRTEKYLKTLDPKAVSLFRPFIKKAKSVAANLGYDYFIVSGNRTWAEQDALYAQGRTKPGNRVTNAKGGQSNHNFGVAVDFGVFKDGKYLDDSSPSVASKVHKAVGSLAGKYGLDWGGSWKSIVDEPHFEVESSLSMAEKRERYQKRGSIF